MFIVAFVLFLAGMALFAVAFMVSAFQGLVFAAGILLICLAMALPMHVKAK
ncbi:hypothetical protein GCM10022219_26610 [Microbacterium oryzae]|uniref:hypothetical protein n=1 Tax=Microbacterium oryzae TaxID=743009 RepID=UPI0015631234|nr:hypothetical protein [Microbacterium oryzae]